MKISVIGAGGWGTALAMQAAKKNEVVLWSYSEEEASLFSEKGENVYYLPGVKIPSEIKITSDVERAASADLFIFVPPSHFFRPIAQTFKGKISESAILASATKGFEYPTERRMSSILNEEFGGEKRIVVVSGPTHAEEVSRHVPSTMVAASSFRESAEIVQAALSGESFRLYTNDDVTGVEVCGAVKNVIAVAAGMLRGLGFGDNTMAAVITRGLAEIRRMGMALGSKIETFSGLAGVGDLMVTCMSKHSRNGRVGEALAKGKSIEEIQASTKMVAEGVETVKTVIKMEEEMGISMPISHGVYDVIYGQRPPLEVLKELMERPLKNEFD